MLRFVQRDDPTLSEVEFLEDRLYEFNTAATGRRDGLGLAIFVYDDDGRTVAGIAGHTWGGCCEIKQLWVDESLRRQGLGRQLLSQAAEEAKRRGASWIVLSTHSFQAPDLYRRLGFEEVGRFDDYPVGHAQIFLRKRLA